MGGKSERDERAYSSFFAVFVVLARGFRSFSSRFSRSKDCGGLFHMAQILISLKCIKRSECQKWTVDII